MKPETLERLLLRHGDDIERWPAWYRFAARRLLSQSTEARELLALARREDRQLRQAMSPQALPPELLQRLERIPAQFPRPATTPTAPSRGEQRSLLRLGTAWALACGLSGVLLGSSGWLSVGVDDNALAMLAFGSAGESDISLEDLP